MLDMKRMLGSRAALALGAWVAYALAFIPLYHLVGASVAAVGILPVVATGELFGMRAGLLAGLLAFSLNMLLMTLGGAGWDVMIRGGLLGSIVIVLIGAVVGRLRDMGEQVKQELIKRKQAEEALYRAHGELEMQVQERTADLAQANEALRAEITERKQAEEALRESEEKYRTILENIEDGYYEVDLAGNLTFFNDSLCRLYGYSEHELMGMNYRQYMDAETARAVYQTYNTVYRIGKPTEAFDWEVIRKDGIRRSVEVSVSLMRGPTSEPIGFRGIIRDITERKRAEEALRESEECFRLAVEATRDGLWENSFGHQRDFFSDRMFTMLGYEPMDPAHAYDFFNSLRHPDDIENHEKNLNMINEPGHDDYSVEMRLQAKDGTWRHILSRGKCVERDEKGTPVRFVGTHTDITDLKRAEEEIRQLKEFNEGIVQGMEEGIIMEGAEGHITFVNPKMAEILGYTEEELAGKHWSEIIAPLCLRQVEEESSKRPKGISTQYEAMLLRKDKREVPGLISASPLFRESEFVGTLGVFTDLTKIKEIEQQLIQAGKLAAIGQLVAGVAHELNNPLTSVVGYSHLLLKAECSEEIKRDLDRINRQALRAARIVENLLTFARRREPRKESINLNEVIGKSLELQAHQLELDRISIVKELDEALLPTLADPFQMQQVFMNIIGNAHQALRDWEGERQLKVSSELAGDMICLEFADSGPGIHPEVMGRLFEPFFTTREVGQGTGLGLSISYGIVEAHGGKIWAKSEVGKGAIFIVEIPMNRSVQETSPHPRPLPTLTQPPPQTGEERARGQVPSPTQGEG